MTHEQVEAAARFYEPAMAALVDRGAAPEVVRASAVVLACQSLLDLESLAEDVRRELADSRTPSRLARHYARSSRRLRELIADYRAMLNMPAVGAAL